MRISRQTKHALTLILGTAIGFMMITLLFVNIAMPGTQNVPQAAYSGFAGEQAQAAMTAEQPVSAQSEPAQETVAAPVAPAATEEPPPEESALSPIPAPEAGANINWIPANVKLPAFFIISALGVILFCINVYLMYTTGRACA